MTPSDDNDRLRKMLKDLPQIPARADFEERLQRRLSAERSGRRGWGWFDAHRRPALAYSALTVLIVGLISYVALERSGVPGPEPPALRQTVGDSAAGKTPAPQTAPPAENRLKEADQAPSKKMQAPVRHDAPAPPVPEETRQAAEEEHQPTGQESIVLPAEKAVPSVPSPARVLEKGVAPPEAQSAPEVKSRSLAMPTDRRLRRYSVDSGLTDSELTLIDSIARFDSVRADSLRKALQFGRKRIKP